MSVNEAASETAVSENQPEINNKMIQPEGEINHYQFKVKMSCRGCLEAVDRTLKNIPEIIKHTIDLQTKLVDVWCTIAYDDVLAAIKQMKEVVGGKVLPVQPDDLTV